MGKLSKWMHDTSLPLHVEILFDAGLGAALPVLLERWSFSYSYEQWNASTSRGIGASTSGGSDGNDLPAAYKKVVLLLRTMWTKSLLLPVHKLFKKLCKLKLSPSRIIYYIKSQPTAGVEFAGNADTRAFADVWMTSGVLRARVQYLLDCSQLQPALPAAGHMLIADYQPQASPRVGSAPSSGPLPSPRGAGAAVTSAPMLPSPRSPMLPSPRSPFAGTATSAPIAVTTVTTAPSGARGVLVRGNSAALPPVTAPHAVAVTGTPSVGGGETFLVGSYQYSTSPSSPLSGNILTPAMSGARATRAGSSPPPLRSFGSSPPVQPSLVLSIVPHPQRERKSRHDELEDSEPRIDDDESDALYDDDDDDDDDNDDNDSSNNRTASIETDEDGDVAALAQLQETSELQSPFAGAESDAMINARQVRQFIARCDAPPRLAMFVVSTAERQPDYYSNAYDDIRNWLDANLRN